jgi:NAD(P)-dependent dehydrogenase (short-subunit alcohol dehydrogenase family)
VFQRTIDVNLTGAFHCTQIAGKAMIEQGGGGRIVFITSLAVNVTASAQADYAASKAGLHMLMKSFAIALGRHGITCNAVAPGMILTDMTRFHWEQPEPAAFIRTRVPVGRIGTPEDVGNAVALLCADEAAYINGVGIIVDGGHQAVCA